MKHIGKSGRKNPVIALHTPDIDMNTAHFEKRLQFSHTHSILKNPVCQPIRTERDSTVGIELGRI